MYINNSYIKQAWIKCKGL